MFAPIITMQSLSARLCSVVVAPPRPSRPGLVLHRHDAEPGGEELADQVVLLVIEGCAAEVADRQGAVERSPLVVLLLIVRVAGGLDSLGDLLDGPGERLLLPVVAVGSAVFDL
jgi:hypothetical protein